MKTYRENPDGDENRKSTRQSEREIFALQMMAREQADEQLTANMDNEGYRRCNCEDYPCCGH